MTAAAILGEGPREGKVASTTFLSRLAKDAIVVTSDAFVLDKTKRRVFATTMSRATPAELEAALRERHGVLEKKYGAAITSPATLVSAAEVWEAWWAKQAGTF